MVYLLCSYYEAVCYELNNVKKTKKSGPLKLVGLLKCLEVLATSFSLPRHVTVGGQSFASSSHLSIYVVAHFQRTHNNMNFLGATCVRILEKLLPWWGSEIESHYCLHCCL